VYFVAFLPDGKSLMSGAEDHTIRLWDVEGGRELSVWQKTGEFDEKAPSTKILSLSANGAVLARAGGPQGTVELWDVPRVTRIRAFPAHQRPVSGLALSANATTLVTFSEDESKAWTADSGRQLAAVKAPNLYRVRAVAVTADGSLFAVATSDKVVTTYQTGTARIVAQFDAGPGQLHALAFSPDAKLLAVGSDGGPEDGSPSTVQVRDLAKNVWVEGVPFPSAYATAVSFSSDGRFLGSAGRTVKVWDLSSHQTYSFGGHETPVRSIAFSPDGHVVATGSEDNLVGLWRIGA
jgi:WD40 repeat protein